MGLCVRLCCRCFPDIHTFTPPRRQRSAHGTGIPGISLLQVGKLRASRHTAGGRAMTAGVGFAPPLGVHHASRGSAGVPKQRAYCPGSALQRVPRARCAALGNETRMHPSQCPHESREGASLRQGISVVCWLTRMCSGLGFMTCRFGSPGEVVEFMTSR